MTVVNADRHFFFRLIRFTFRLIIIFKYARLRFFVISRTIKQINEMYPLLLLRIPIGFRFSAFRFFVKVWTQPYSRTTGECSIVVGSYTLIWFKPSWKLEVYFLFLLIALLQKVYTKTFSILKMMSVTMFLFQYNRTHCTSSLYWLH